jgi:type III secretory pathway component EscU
MKISTTIGQQMDFFNMTVTEPSVIISWNMLYQFTFLVFITGFIAALVFDYAYKRYKGRKA